MIPVKNSYPLIATLRHAPGNVELKPFYSEADFIRHTDWARPMWGILVEEFTGKIVTQVSYPQENNS